MHILILEDNGADVELMKRELRKAGLDFTAQWAQDREAFLAALETSAPDLILADYSLPGFDGLTALTFARQRWQDVPVIIVSGAIGEEVAIETLKAGATDYVLKQRLSRLGPVVRRAMQEANQVAERKQAEATLRQREKELRLIMNAGPTLISYIDADCRYRWVNKTYELWFGLAAEEVRGRHVRDILGGPAWQVIRPYAERALAGELVTYELQVPLQKVRTRWLHATYTPDADDSGRIQGFVVHSVDVTERRQAEDALRETHQRLQLQAEELAAANEGLRISQQTLQEMTRTLETKVTQRTSELEYRARQLQKLALELPEAEDRERRRLAEILHDDLQQILVAAKFHLNSIRNRVKYDPSLQATAAQIDHMLKDAIDKSRSLSHELSPAVLHHGDFSEILEWLAGQIRAKHGLLVHVDATDKIDLQSDALKTFLYKAAQELLFNVVKHARTNEAGIRVRRRGRCLCLVISDRGRGFDPQERGETAGFGLFNIRERVELLGGRMKIKSAEGKGSTFHIVVPNGDLSKKNIVGRQEPDGRAKESWPAQREGQRRLRVLLADDHEIVREGLVCLLGEEHRIHVVGEATNGREAVDLAGRLQPDVVIMDVAMPLIDGAEATRQIKRHLPNTRIIALSMSEDPDTVERMHAAGAEAYVLKTAPSEELLAAIRGRQTVET